MKTATRSQIFDEKTTAEIVDQLQPTLTDLIALGLITKQAHWNVTGPNFRPIHLHLDEIYDVIQEGVDTIAERIAALGVSPSGQANEVSKDTALSQVPLGFLRDVQVVDLMTDRIGNACRLIRDRLAQIEDTDTVTADMLHQILESLEKHLWMLRVQRD